MSEITSAAGLNSAEPDWSAGSGGQSGSPLAAGLAGPGVLSNPDGPAVMSIQRSRPPKLYRIGEVVEYSGLSRQTIHNYTVMGLIHESRWTQGGHRQYDESVFERLDRIAQLRMENRSLAEICKHFLQDEAGNDVVAV